MIHRPIPKLSATTAEDTIRITRFRTHKDSILSPHIPFFYTWHQFLSMLALTLLVFAGQVSAQSLSLKHIPSGGGTAGIVSGRGTQIVVEVSQTGITQSVRAIEITFDFDLSLLTLTTAPSGWLQPGADTVTLLIINPAPVPASIRFTFTTKVDVTGRNFSIGLKQFTLDGTVTIPSSAMVSFNALCPGDFDNNGVVNVADFLLFANAFGKRSSDAGYNALMDMDSSGSINVADFLLFANVFGTTCKQPPRNGGGTPNPDRDALVALYNATNGPNWTNNTNWLSDKPLGEWHGVTTNANGRVTELRFLGNQLTGSIPSSLGNLNNLTSLDFQSNQLTGSIPPELGNLTNLTRLYLNNNQLTGSIPPELGNLTNLTALLIWNNQLSGSISSALGRLSNLRGLGLSDNQLTGSIPSWLGNLTNLTGLSLGGNQLSGNIPPELGRLSNLELLNLNNNQLTGSIPPELSNLTNLERLLLGGNQLTGSIPSWLGNLTNLRLLWLFSNTALSGMLPSSLVNLTNLEQLWLNNTQLCAPTDAAFQTWLQGIENKLGVTKLRGREQYVGFHPGCEPSCSDRDCIAQGERCADHASRNGELDAACGTELEHPRFDRA